MWSQNATLYFFLSYKTDRSMRDLEARMRFSALNHHVIMGETLKVINKVPEAEILQTHLQTGSRQEGAWPVCCSSSSSSGSHAQLHQLQQLHQRHLWSFSAP